MLRTIPVTQTNHLCLTLSSHLAKQDQHNKKNKRVIGFSPVKIMSPALNQMSCKVQGDTQVSGAVAEFKGPVVFGVVRLFQLNKESAKIEANFSGLSPGKHGWSINEFGDLTKGPASTGKVYDPINRENLKEPLGHLQALDVNEKGDTTYAGVKEEVRISDLIGRSIVVYQTEHKSDIGLKAAVIARTASVEDNNCKRICACDGTPIWEAKSAHNVNCKIQNS